MNFEDIFVLCNFLRARIISKSFCVVVRNHMRQEKNNTICMERANNPDTFLIQGEKNIYGGNFEICDGKSFEI